MVSAPIESALRREVALGQTYEILDTQLPWLNPSFGRFCTKIQENSDAFTYLKDVYNKANDPKAKLPVEHVEGTKFPEIDRTRKTITAQVLKEKGFSLRIGKELLKSVPKAEVEIQDNYEYAAYSLGCIANQDMIAAAKAGANTTTTAFSAKFTESWENVGGAADPVGDLMHLSQDMDVDGFEGTLTDAWLHKTNWYEFQDYLKNVHIPADKQAMMGAPDIHADFISIPLVGDIHKVPTGDTGISEGQIIGMDRNHPGIEYHYRLDTEFSDFKIQYNTRGPNGGMVRASTDNFGFHYRWYQELQSRDIIQEFWLEAETVVKKPYNLIYATGI